MPEIELSTVATEKGLAGGPFGSSLVGADYVDAGVPVIRGGNMGARFVGGEFAFVTPEKVEAELVRNTAIPGDVVFTQRGTLGQVSLVPAEPYERYVVSQSQMRLRVDPRATAAQFVYYACKRSEFLKQISDNAISTGVPHVNLGILGRLTIPAFPLAKQRAIAEVLGALDDKIAANDHVVRASDGLCAALVAQATAKGQRARLRDLVILHYGKALPASQRRVGQVTVVGSGGPTGTHDTPLVDRPGIVLGRKGTVGAVHWCDSAHYPIDTTYHVEPRGGLSSEVLFYLLRSMPLAELNSDSAVPGLNREEAYAQSTNAPENPGLLTQMLRPKFELMAAVRRESARLAATRDELLPLLMSGKIRVKDAEKATEGAL